jgi:hypothetical protein
MIRHLLAIDPGPTESAFVVFNGERITELGIEPSRELLTRFHRETFDVEHLAVEGIQSYGMAVGKEVFDTCIWIGRYIEAAQAGHTIVYRSEVKLHLCKSARAKDPNIRAAILDRFGGKERAIGRKKAPGPLYGVSSHCWSALAVALTYWDQNVGTLQGARSF